MNSDFLKKCSSTGSHQCKNYLMIMILIAHLFQIKIKHSLKITSHMDHFNSIEIKRESSAKFLAVITDENIELLRVKDQKI